MKKWYPLVVLAAAQFLTVLDTSVMNVAISQLVVDFDTDVTRIQMAITFYALTMAAFMITGGKLGDVWGRRRAFRVGLVVYAAGSGLTAVSWSVPVLIFGWSFLEGIGAALVLPNMAAITATTYRGRDRALAFGSLGGIAGAAVAIGPILGGWLTTSLTWRVAFAFGAALALVILASSFVITGREESAETREVDWVGAALSALGLALIVYGALQSSQWGVVAPRNSPIEPFGFALTPFVVAAGGAILYGFVQWERHREALGRDPLLRLALFENETFRGATIMTTAQQVILAGAFFAVPLYLQITLGLDALETGIRMFPISVTLLVTSMVGAPLLLRYQPRRVVRYGLAVLLVATGVLLAVIDPQLDGAGFALAMALFGFGIGILVSVLGNLIQSAVSERDRSEAGGLDNASSELGTAVGTAVIGAIVISGLATSFGTQVANDPQISEGIVDAIEVELAGGVSFISAGEVRQILDAAPGLDRDTADAIVENYEESQLEALRAALFAVAIIILFCFVLTRGLPTRRIDEISQSRETGIGSESSG